MIAVKGPTAVGVGRSRLAWTLLLLPALLGPAATASAQAFTEDPIAAEFAGEKAKAKRGEEERFLSSVGKGETPYSPEALARIGAYFNGYLFPRMTRLDGLDKVPGYRMELLGGKFLGGIANPELRSKLLQAISTKMKALVAGNYHPGVKHNAMLVLADLNEREAATSLPRQPPLPYQKDESATYFLQQLTDAKPSDAIKVAALMGLRRHALIFGQMRSGGYDDARRSAIRDACLAIVNNPPPPGRSLEGHQWMRMLAIETLGNLRDLGPNAIVKTTLEKVLADPAEADWVKTAAVRSYGLLPFDPKATAEVPFLFGRLAIVAHEFVTKELAFLEAEKKNRQNILTGPSTPGASMPMYDPMGSYGSSAEMEGYSSIPPAFRAGIMASSGYPTSGGPAAAASTDPVDQEPFASRRQYVLDMSRGRLAHRLETILETIEGRRGDPATGLNRLSPLPEGRVSELSPLQSYQRTLIDKLKKSIEELQQPDQVLTGWIDLLETKVTETTQLVASAPRPATPEAAAPADAVATPAPGGPGTGGPGAAAPAATAPGAPGTGGPGVGGPAAGGPGAGPGAGP